MRLSLSDHIPLLRARGQRSNPASAQLQPINLALIEMHGSMIFDSELQIGDGVEVRGKVTAAFVYL